MPSGPVSTARSTFGRFACKEMTQFVDASWCLSIYIDAELIADPLHDVGRKDDHARLKTQGFKLQFLPLSRGS